MNATRVRKEPRLRFGMLLPRGRTLKPAPRPPGDHVYSFFFARNAIYHGLGVLGLSAGDAVLVPSYHCATLVEPILRYGSRVLFYNVHEDCTPDFEDIERRIDSGTRAILAIHYFGFPQSMERFRRLCRDHRLSLIEDCAHVLAGEIGGRPLGSLGDIAVFSWRKFLPLYGAGHLVVNGSTAPARIPRGRTSLLMTVKVARNVLARLVEDSPSRVLGAIARIGEYPARAARRLAARGGGPSEVWALDDRSLEFDLSLVDLPMPGISRYVLGNCRIEDVAERRRRNYDHLAGLLRSAEGVAPLHGSAPRGTSPWVFPLRARGRRDFHRALRERGVPAVTWGGVMHPALPVREFPEARALYDELVFLPIHQSLERADIEAIGSAVRIALASAPAPSGQAS